MERMWSISGSTMVRYGEASTVIGTGICSRCQSLSVRSVFSLSTSTMIASSLEGREARAKAMARSTGLRTVETITRACTRAGSAAAWWSWLTASSASTAR